ncbi:MAG: hypothetical protein ACI8W8_002968 [Rhodothermales bacterium]|jgi:uncharacterized protein (DUF58 family)
MSDLDARVRRLQLSCRKPVEELLAGEYKSVFKGRGIEFEEVREYQPGDEIRSIDWNVTARTGRPFVKQFVEERELTLYILMDVSASFVAGAVGEEKRAAAAELATLLSLAAVRNNDRVSLMLFTNELEHYIPPRKQESQVRHIISELLSYPPKATGTNIGAVLDFLSRITRRRAIVFLFSDFQCTDFIEPMRIVAQQHDLIAVSVTDEHETELPNVGLVRLRDSESGQFNIVDTGNASVRESLAHAASAYQEELTAVLAEAQVDHLPIHTHEDYLSDLIQFFEQRRRA